MVPEVARALVLPDQVPLSTEMLLTLLLCWESVDIVFLSEELAQSAADAGSSELEEHGLVSHLIAANLPVTFRFAPDGGYEPPSATASIQEVAAVLCKAIGIDDFASDLGSLFAGQFEARVRLVRRHADRCGIPSIAVSEFSAAAASFPADVDAAPRPEAALANASLQGIRVLPGTTIEDVLSFREKNGRLMGRFRASVVDLARTMQHDAPPAVILEQADAVIKNRVEPALADLEDRLKRGRIRYVWRMLTGVTSVLFGPATTAVAATHGGRISAQALDYAFDRDALLREHPYGLLHALRSEFGESPTRRATRAARNPLSELKAQYVEAIRALVTAEPSFWTHPTRDSSPAWTEVEVEFVEALRALVMEECRARHGQRS